MMVDAHFIPFTRAFFEFGDCIDKNLGFEILVVYTCVPTLHTHTHTHTTVGLTLHVPIQTSEVARGHARLVVWCVCCPAARGPALLSIGLWRHP